nr:GNAT family N-acetyltransferase [Petropleomorpha daqingensis]
MVYRAELAYIRDVEPDAEPAWIRATDRNLELWVANLLRTTVAEVAGEPAGFVMWMPTGQTATVVTVQVLPEFRRCGLGRRLLDRVVADADGRSVELGVHRANPARALYERAGFTRVSERGDYLMYRRDRTTLPA